MGTALLQHQGAFLRSISCPESAREETLEGDALEKGFSLRDGSQTHFQQTSGNTIEAYKKHLYLLS